MKIVICGLGYVGATAAACLLRQGHHVTGVDVDDAKTTLIAAGASPVSEPGVGELLAAGLADGRLAATGEVGPALDNADAVIVCVGTPSLASGALDLSRVRAVVTELGAALAGRRAGGDPLMVVVRSTLPPGAMDGVILPAIAEAAGGPPGAAYEIAYNPEFLRESTAVADYFAPARIVIGEREPGVARRLRGLYDGIDAPVFETTFAEAESIKLIDTAFHALKVAFANEVGRIAVGLDVEAGRVIDVFLADTKLNVSPAYLRPGGAFGGSCLPKDVAALAALAAAGGTDIPVLANLLASNEAHKRHIAERVMAAAPRGGRILLAGLSFKAETDDLRESPLVDLAETLIGKGYDLAILDPDLSGRTLIGANLAFVEGHLPHLSRLLVESVEQAGAVDLIVIGKPGMIDAPDPATPVLDIGVM